MLATQSVPPIAIGIVIALVGGGLCAVLMTLLRKRRDRIGISFQTTAVAREEMIQKESMIDRHMDQLQEAHEQSLRGQTLTGTQVREKLEQDKKPKPTFIDAKVEELKGITEVTPKKV